VIPNMDRDKEKTLEKRGPCELCRGKKVIEYQCNCGNPDCTHSEKDECVACNGTGILTYKNENLCWH
jgi:hypothetical protein